MQQEQLPLYKNPEWLKEQYWEKELSIAELSKIAQVSYHTIYYWMDKNKIARRTISESNIVYNKKNIQLYKDKNWLTEQYWGFELSAFKIAKICGTTTTNILRWTKRYNIPTIPKNEIGLLRNEYGQKQCTNCKEWKDEINFYYNSSKNNLECICKSCTIKNVHNYSLNNLNKIKERKKKYWKKYKDSDNCKFNRKRTKAKRRKSWIS